MRDNTECHIRSTESTRRWMKVAVCPFLQYLLNYSTGLNLTVSCSVHVRQFQDCLNVTMLSCALPGIAGDEKCFPNHDAAKTALLIIDLQKGNFTIRSLFTLSLPSRLFFPRWRHGFQLPQLRIVININLKQRSHFRTPFLIQNKIIELFAVWSIIIILFTFQLPG
jgi:hypothetical protein